MSSQLFFREKEKATSYNRAIRCIQQINPIENVADAFLRGRMPKGCILKRHQQQS